MPELFCSVLVLSLFQLLLLPSLLILCADLFHYPLETTSLAFLLLWLAAYPFDFSVMADQIALLAKRLIRNQEAQQLTRPPRFHH